MTNSAHGAPANPDAVSELLAAANAVVARWDSPKWKDQPHTAEFIGRLRSAAQAVTDSVAHAGSASGAGKDAGPAGGAA